MDMILSIVRQLGQDFETYRKLFKELKGVGSRCHYSGSENKRKTRAVCVTRGFLILPQSLEI
jgi:hypothetical protein